MNNMLLIDDSKYKAMTFSGGERHIELLVSDEDLVKYPDIVIEKRVQSANDIMDILLLNEILRRKNVNSVSLKMLYIPYARQDRATTPNTPRALKVFADLMNSCNFRDVFVLDPHSMVAENLINNMRQLNVVPYIKEFMNKMGFTNQNTILVSPDVGAIKKVERYAKELGITDVMAFHKERNPATGEIKGIKIIQDVADIDHRNILVVDDICDGGRTFIELVKSCTDLQPFAGRTLNLFVTHGIFSYGLQPLIDAGFQNIGCTDSFIPSLQCVRENKELTIINA